jgi:peptidoglycan-associated lipoprotein
MRKISEFGLMGMLAVTSLLVQACATQSGSGAGDEHMAQTELIDEPTIQHIPPPEFSLTTSRAKPSMRAEVSARNATGLSSDSIMDVLFDFDRATLREEALPVLEANARVLKQEGVTRLLLEGRGDEMGSSEYNLVLGDRRAKRVRSYLQDLGLSVDLVTTSYGKDRPLCFQRNSECFQKNRSVRFIVKE